MVSFFYSSHFHANSSTGVVFCAKNTIHSIIIVFIKLSGADYNFFVTDSLIILSTTVKPFIPAVLNQSFRKECTRFLPIHLMLVVQFSQKSKPANLNDTHSCAITNVEKKIHSAFTLESST